MVEDRVIVKDKKFKLSIDEQTICAEVDRVAKEICADLREKNPIFLSVLNGSFMFMSDLMKRVDIPAEVSFIKLESYCGTETTGCVKQIMGLSKNIENRTVVVVEDIVDTGLTMQQLLEDLEKYHPQQIKVCTLLYKPGKLKVPLHIDYVGFSIPNDFIVGYGLDYDDYGRNLPCIYTLE